MVDFNDGNFFKTMQWDGNDFFRDAIAFNVFSMLFDGFGVRQPLFSMVYNGCPPLVQQWNVWNVYHRRSLSEPVSYPPVAGDL